MSDDPNLVCGRWFISELGLEEGFKELAVGEGDDSGEKSDEDSSV